MPKGAYTIDELYELPLSDMIELGLQDLRLQEKTGVVDMIHWLKHCVDGVCVACFAGSVMLHTLDLPQWQPGAYDTKLWAVASALNKVRRGCVAGALGDLYREAPPYDQLVQICDPDELVVYPYDEAECLIACYNPNNTEPFYRDMQQLADRLRAAKL